MSASLQNEFISDTYTSLLHLSGGGLYTNPPRRDVYDGSGNITGFTLSGTQVIANNVALPEQHVEQKVDGEGNPQITSLIDMFFPIGSIQMTIDNVNPENRIPGTRWVPVAGGRFVVSAPSAADDGGVGNPSYDYGAYSAGYNPGGSSGYLSEVSLIESQLPKHTHVPAENAGFGNVVTWTSTTATGGYPFIGPIDGGQVPNPTGRGTGPPIYAFPATQPIAQTLSEVGANQAFSISPMSYGVYIWRRVPFDFVDIGPPPQAVP